MTRRRKLLIFITLAALVLLVGYLRSDPLSAEEQRFVGHWQTVAGAPLPFDGHFGEDRWMVTHHQGPAIDYQWRVSEGTLIVTEAIENPHPKHFSLSLRIDRFFQSIAAIVFRTQRKKDDTLVFVYEFLPDHTLQLQAVLSTTFPEPLKLRLQRVPSEQITTENSP